MPLKCTTALINGITYTLELGEDGAYHAIVPAPKIDEADLVEYRSYPVVLQSEDMAGNLTVKDKDDPELGGGLRLVVKEDIYIITRRWSSSDYFNYADYNRIKYNISYIKRIADLLFEPVEFVNMGSDKNYQEYPQAEEFHTIERNLNYICTAAGLPLEQYGLHIENGSFLNFESLNQIEESCRRLFDRLHGIMKARKRFSFQLGKRGIL